MRKGGFTILISATLLPIGRWTDQNSQASIAADRQLLRRVVRAPDGGSDGLFGVPNTIIFYVFFGEGI